MKKVLLGLTLLLSCAPVLAVDLSNYEFELDVTTVHLEHAWRAPEEYRDATFIDTVCGIGGTVWRGPWGFRTAYLEGTLLNTTEAGYYDHITINLDHIISFELLYRYHITSDLRLIAGIGTHLIPVPQYYEGIDPTSHAATDADNDEGYILGLQYKITDNASIGWRFTHYSRITDHGWDEWTKGHSINITYHF